MSLPDSKDLHPNATCDTNSESCPWTCARGFPLSLSFLISKMGIKIVLTSQHGNERNVVMVHESQPARPWPWNSPASFPRQPGGL